MNNRCDISINDQSISIPIGTSLAELIAGQGFEIGQDMFAVAINCVFVPREEYTTRVLEPGDEIDVVEPISGG